MRMTVTIECSSIQSFRDQMVEWMEEKVKHHTMLANKTPGARSKYLHQTIAKEYEEISSFWRNVEIKET